MPRYVLMTRLSPQVMQDPRGRQAVGKEWKARVDRLCPEVKWIAHYALLGPYDFMDIYEAPDDVIAHKVSLISRVSGALSAESWPAIPWESYLELADEVEEDSKSDS
jgi:uncharacterized protein with GYD domain